MLGDLALIEAVLLAIVLAPTDAALGQAVVSDERIPSRVRQGLNVESGLNDGICVPLLLIAIAVAEAQEGAIGDGAAVHLVLEEIGYGCLGGVIAGAAAAAAIGIGVSRGLIDAIWLQIIPVAGAGLAYGLAVWMGGSGFIAAFVAGAVFGGLRREVGGEATRFLEEAGELLGAVTFILFGAVMLVPMLDELSVEIVLYALLSLTVVRMVPVALAMLGSGARPPTVAFLGWFGPRGLASIVFAVILVEEADLAHESVLLNAIFLDHRPLRPPARPDRRAARRALRRVVRRPSARRGSRLRERAGHRSREPLAASRALEPLAVMHQLAGRWSRLTLRHKLLFVGGALAALVVVAAALNFISDNDGLSLIDPSDPTQSYVAVFVLVALDAVVPIFPGETTLNAAATAAAQGTLELAPVIVMGALGAIVGDSACSGSPAVPRRGWRRSSKATPEREDQAGARHHGRERTAAHRRRPLRPGHALRRERDHGPLRHPLPPLPGLVGTRGVLWSTYTCLLAYKIGSAVADYPLASVVISGLVTTAVLGIIFVVIRRRHRARAPMAEPDAPAR